MHNANKSYGKASKQDSQFETAANSCKT